MEPHHLGHCYLVYHSRQGLRSVEEASAALLSTAHHQPTFRHRFHSSSPYSLPQFVPFQLTYEIARQVQLREHRLDRLPQSRLKLVKYDGQYQGDCLARMVSRPHVRGANNQLRGKRFAPITRLMLTGLQEWRTCRCEIIDIMACRKISCTKLDIPAISLYFPIISFKQYSSCHLFETQSTERE